MKELTTLSPTAFALRKDEAIRNEVMRKEISLSEFNVMKHSLILLKDISINMDWK